MKRKPYVRSARHQQPARTLSDPRPGFFRVREVAGGPWMPARIFRPCPLEMPVDAPWQWLDRWPPLQADIDGRPVSIDRVWTWGEPILAHRRHYELCSPQALDEWMYLTLAAAWERRHAPEGPLANPRRRVDFSTAPLPF